MKKQSTFNFQFAGAAGFATGLALAGLMACGGGSSKPSPPAQINATKIEYTDPTGDGYKFVRDAAQSTSTRLVLELRGPASGTCRGVSFCLTSDAKVAFSKVNQSDTEYAQNVAFDLGTTDPKLFKAIKDGNALRVSIAQKGTGNQPNTSGTLLRIALEMAPNSIAQNTTIPLTPSDARCLPASGGSEPITILVGSLIAK